jgi:hypothetical protein
MFTGDLFKLCVKKPTVLNSINIYIIIKIYNLNITIENIIIGI